MTVIEIPYEATQALNVMCQVFSNCLIGVYLYGSAVLGGLRPDSDIDILVIVSHALSEEIRKDLLHRLMNVSGKVGNVDKIRSIEVTVIAHDDVVPWRYPPKREFIYGEWLRSKYELGYIPESEYESDLTTNRAIRCREQPCVSGVSQREKGVLIVILTGVEKDTRLLSNKYLSFLIAVD